jgi:hypothetical protein
MAHRDGRHEQALAAKGETISGHKKPQKAQNNQGKSFVLLCFFVAKV